MMRRKFSTILTMLMIFLVLSGGALKASAAEIPGDTKKAGGAADSGSTAPSFFFELSVDGKESKEVESGDIITVVLKLKRTDAAEDYTMYAMQDEIRYDSTFLELVEGSAMLGKGIASTDIAMVDEHREFYMNYLSLSGGEQWNAETLIGSFQLKVTGESGVTKITSQDYLVSLQDGSGSYPCETNEVTIILSTDCRVTFRTGGGSELEDITVQFGEKIPCPEDPVREGYELEGWYKDIHLTEKWDFEEDTVEGNMSLYAKWVEAAEEATTQVTEEEHGCRLWWLWIIVLAGMICFLIWWKKQKQNKTDTKFN